MEHDNDENAWVRGSTMLKYFTLLTGSSITRESAEHVKSAKDLGKFQ